MEGVQVDDWFKGDKDREEGREPKEGQSDTYYRGYYDKDEGSEDE